MTDERFQQARNGGKAADFTPAFTHSGVYISNESYTVITHSRDMAANIFPIYITTGLQTLIDDMKGGSTAGYTEYAGQYRMENCRHKSPLFR